MSQLLEEMGWFLYNVRRLEPPTEPPRVREITGTEARRLLDRRFTGQGSRVRFAAEQRLYAFLGLIPDDLDLYQLQLDIAAEQSPAWHLPSSNEIQVVPTSETTGVREALLLAYAYSFLLQERYFGLSALLDDAAIESDRRLALDALSIGDASLSMTLYGANRFPTVGPEEVAGGVETRVLDSAPFVVQQLFLFPYTFGADFVVGLQGAGGWEGVNSAYERPPLSATEVLHPLKYLQGFAPTPVSLPDLAGALGPGWSADSEGVLGEFRLRIYLGSAIPGLEAAAGAGGWAGDRYALLQGPQGKLLAFRSAWEDVAEAEAFFAAYASFTDERRAWSSSERDDERGSWRADDEAVALAVAGTDVWLVVGPDGDTVRRAADAIAGE